jgi:hypothetical protein
MKLQSSEQEILSPLPTPNDKLDMENRLGDYFVFLRRLISRSPMGKFLSKPHWIKLLLSFLSVKPCNDVETLLRMDEEVVGGEKEEEDEGESGNSPLKSAAANMDIPGPSSEAQENKNSWPEDSSPVVSGKRTGFGVGGLELSKNILFTPGLRPRLLAVQLLEILLGNFPRDSSDLKEQVRNLNPILLFSI